jgi:predicted SAM-dependent methyltransferase
MQIIILNKLLLDGTIRLKDSCLHFAPEPFITPYLRNHFDKYITADLFQKSVDLRMDVTKMTLKDSSVSFIYISHVLEHVQDDLSALNEIYRVLKSNGCALIAVPVLYDRSIEYEQPNPKEFGHVRGVGFDYFEKVKKAGFKVNVFSSNDLSDDTYRTSYRHFKDYKSDIPDYVAICQK